MFYFRERSVDFSRLVQPSLAGSGYLDRLRAQSSRSYHLM